MEPRVGMMTSWGEACGIATYSEELATALVRRGVWVMGLGRNEPGGMMRHTELPATPCWARQNRASASMVGNTLRQYEINILHVQHEHGLFPSTQVLLYTLHEARKSGCKIVVTLHTVHPFGGWEDSGLHDNLRKLADVIVVHTTQGRAALAAVDGPAQVLQIPHGTNTVGDGDRSRGYELLNIPDRMRDAHWCLVFGFVSPNKNLLATIYGYAEARARKMVRDLGLVICGSSREDIYANMTVPAAIMQTGYETSIIHKDMYVSADRVADAMAVADFGILNTHGMDTLSASGQTHIYAAHGVPLAVADKPIYAEAIKAGAVPFQLHAGNPALPSLSLVNAIGALANSADLRASVREQFEVFAAETRWTHLADTRYVPLYQELLSNV